MTLRRSRLKLIAGAFVCGTVLQFGGCITAAINGSLAAIDFCALLGPDCALGPLAPCGDPNTTADDLLADCPLPVDDGQ